MEPGNEDRRDTYGRNYNAVLTKVHVGRTILREGQFCACVVVHSS